MNLNTKAKTQAEARAAKDRKRIEFLEEQVGKLEESLERARKIKRTKLPVPGKSRTSKGSFIRFFLPDSHGAHVDEAAQAALLADLKLLQPRQIFLMGDHLDCGGFLAEHHTLGYVAETETSFEDDVAKANQLLDAVQDICPKSEKKYLEGNHEARIEKWCISVALRKQEDAAYLYRTVGPENVLALEKRNIPFIRKAKTYEGCRIQGCWKAGNCYVYHGTKHGKNAAQATLARFGANVVFGHVHKLMAVMDRTVSDGEIGGWSVGHIGRQQPLWRHGDPTDWTQGYGFQIVQPDGKFLHINVPIIDGKSLLNDLGKLLS